MSTTASIVKRAQELNTPQLLKTGLLLTWGAALLVMLSAIAAVQAQRQAIKSVGLDAAPSILNAERIQDSLANLDANIANEFLAKPGENPDAVAGYEKRRNKLSRLLVAVAENITYGDDERLPIQTLQIKTLEYIQLTQQARDAHMRGDNATMLQLYRTAADMMDKDLIPAAIQVAEVNSTNLDQAYKVQKNAAGGSLFVLIVTGLLLLGALVGLQVFLYLRMRRILNPGLLGASAIALLFLTYAVGTLNSAAHQLKVAKEDAFDSLFDLRRARALSYSANGDANRYLLDPQFATQHQQSFSQKVNQIAEAPPNMTLAQVINQAESQDSSFRMDGFQGFLASELGNITFEGEKQANLDALRAFSNYLEVDQKIRGLQASGQRQAAIALATGNQPGHANQVFDQYLKAHQKVMDINTAEFKQATQKGLAATGLDMEYKKPDPNAAQKDNQDIYVYNTENPVSTKAITRFEVIATGAIAAIALLTLLGLLPRFKEYSR